MQNSILNNTIKILSDLVSFPCLGGESNLPIARYIESALRSNDIPFHLAPNDTDEKIAIHCRIGEPNDGGIILSAHTDVVPVEGQPWTKAPFALTQEGEKLYARGSSDMKGFIACCLAMLPKMREKSLKKPIYLALSYDEEVVCLGAPHLIKAIQKTYNPQPTFAIIGEPTSMQTITAEKGIGAFQTTVYSSAAHSSMVRSSVSAIEEATYLIQWLVAKMDALIEAGQTDDRFDPPHTTIHVGVIKGGTAVNIISDKCTFEWDVRNIPSDSIPEILVDFEKYCQHRIQEKQKINPDFDIKTVSNFPIVPSLNTSEKSDFVKKINELNGTKEAGTVAYASEAGQYSEGGFESIICGPGDIARAHRADEFIKISELEDCLSFLEKIIDWCRD